ncbi:MAG: hypothetical protein VX804_01490, partial [Candidatus Thermoplasmatota archaeon]|nr:hypothetical protein [Candidatus Thermoplasmatota archaeon]
TCNICKHEWKKTENLGESPSLCPSCDASSDRISLNKGETISLIDELTLLAAHTSAKVTLISADSEDGQTLLKSFVVLGAIFRYSWS